MGCTAPIGSNVLQRQPDQFRRCLVGWKVTSCLDDFTQLSIDAFDGVGGVDHFSYGRREHEKRDDSVPGAPPSCRYRWILLAPRPCLEGLQSLLGDFSIERLIDRFLGFGQLATLSQAA